MSTDLDTATVLEEAADLLLIRGRCKFDAMDQDGRLCAIGAVMAARGLELQPGSVNDNAVRLATERGHFDDLISGYEDPAVIAANRHIGKMLWALNDDADDDFEVIDTLRHVAKDLRNAALVTA